AGAFSKGSSIGATIAVTVLNAHTSAYIAGNADAAGAISIDAENHLAPTKFDLPLVPDVLTPTATVIAGAGAASDGDVAVGGSFTISAESSESMLPIAATAGVADDVGIAASVSIADIHSTTQAYVGDSATVHSGGLDIEATGTFKTTMIAGSVGGAGEAGIG